MTTKIDDGGKMDRMALSSAVGDVFKLNTGPVSFDAALARRERAERAARDHEERERIASIKAEHEPPADDTQVIDSSGNVFTDLNLPQVASPISRGEGYPEVAEIYWISRTPIGVGVVRPDKPPADDTQALDSSDNSTDALGRPHVTSPTPPVNDAASLLADIKSGRSIDWSACPSPYPESPKTAEKPKKQAKKPAKKSAASALFRPSRIPRAP